MAKEHAATADPAATVAAADQPAPDRAAPKPRSERAYPLTTAMAISRDTPSPRPCSSTIDVSHRVMRAPVASRAAASPVKPGGQGGRTKGASAAAVRHPARAAKAAAVRSTIRPYAATSSRFPDRSAVSRRRVPLNGSTPHSFGSRRRVTIENSQDALMVGPMPRESRDTAPVGGSPPPPSPPPRSRRAASEAAACRPRPPSRAASMLPPPVAAAMAAAAAADPPAPALATAAARNEGRGAVWPNRMTVSTARVTPRRRSSSREPRRGKARMIKARRAAADEVETEREGEGMEGERCRPGLDREEEDAGRVLHVPTLSLSLILPFPVASSSPGGWSTRSRAASAASAADAPAPAAPVVDGSCAMKGPAMRTGAGEAPPAPPSPWPSPAPRPGPDGASVAARGAAGRRRAGVGRAHASRGASGKSLAVAGLVGRRIGWPVGPLGAIMTVGPSLCLELGTHPARGAPARKEKECPHSLPSLARTPAEKKQKHHRQWPFSVAQPPAPGASPPPTGPTPLGPLRPQAAARPT